MKLALLIALSADKRSGQPLTPELVPFDEGLKAFKQMVESGTGPAPVVELWSGGRVVKAARFKRVQEPVESPDADAAAAAEKAAAEAAEAEAKAAAEKAAAEAAEAEVKAAAEKAAAEAGKQSKKAESK
jgi:hypothetical protein